MQTRAASHGNRLARETSLYLRQHAANPVDWFPWGEEAFARARALDRPIFLSIGYSTCHWCHVMARESFENPAVAALLNAHFVPVKVDREERPDVDRVHMAYVQSATGQGGWPLSVWLTPELGPFFGATYFPPEDRWGRPGFASVLAELARLWQERREQVNAAAAQAVALLGARAAAGGADGTAADALARCVEYFRREYDGVHGGFGTAPKFPRPAVLRLLLQVHAGAPGAGLLPPVAHTLEAMARGGVRDQIGGGFHRYSVDAAWCVPHFEKMLYDQAQLVVAYLDAWVATGQAELKSVALDTLAYIGRDLGAPEGGYYAAEDADSDRPDRPGEHGEGAFYVWSHAEFAAVCGEAADETAALFSVRRGGNVPPAGDPQGEFRDLNILRREPGHAAVESPAAAAARQRLFTVRQCRPRPGRDEKIVTAWNGLTISALARARQVTGERKWLDDGIRAARFLWTRVRDAETGVLHRSWCADRNGPAGFAEDYAAVVAAFLDLYEAGASIRWLQRAVELQAQMDARFHDSEGGGYWGNAADDPSVIVRLKDSHDGAEPAAGSVAALNLFRLSALLGRDEWRRRGEGVVEALRPFWQDAPWALPQLLAAADFAARPVRQILLVGRRNDPAMERLVAVLHRRLDPARVILWIDGEAERSWFGQHLEWVRSVPIETDRPTAYLCRAGVCMAPISQPAALASALDV